ncbi:MAG: hypothetical protein ACKVOK_01515 [Flavobacteriales bacterium]
MKYTIYLSSLILLVFAGCKTDDEFDGPALNDLYGQFAIVQGLSATNYDVDFSTGEQTTFESSFSKNIDWVLEIKGLQSGAVKRIEGFSNLLNVDNATWNGTTTDLPMFKQESCAVQLTFLSETDTLRDTLDVVGARINEGFVVSDFETGTNPGWNSFVQTGANMSFAVQSTIPAAQGNNYFNIGGTVNWDWLIGLINMPASAYGGTHYPLSENPELENFNVMIYKPEELSNGIMLFQFMEDDNLDGVFTTNVEDMFSLEVQMDKNGWGQYSINYADLQTLINGAPSADIGNGIREPHKLLQISVLFLANPASGYANAYLDYMIFTQNGILEP